MQKTHFSDVPVGSFFTNKHGKFRKLRDANGKWGGSAEVVSHASLAVGQKVSVNKTTLVDRETSEQVVKSRYIPLIDGAVDLSERGGMVRSRTYGHWFIERNGRTDDGVVSEAIETALEHGPLYS